MVALRERAVRAEQEQELRAEQARLGERARIAREMHDVARPQGVADRMHAGALEVQARPSAGAGRRARGADPHDAREAMEDLREVLGVLRADGDGRTWRPQPGAPTSTGSSTPRARPACSVDLPLDGRRPARRAGPHRPSRRAGGADQRAQARTGRSDRGVVVERRRRHGLTVEVVNRRPVAAAALLPGSGAGLVGLRERVGLLGGDARGRPDAATAAGGCAAWLPWTRRAGVLPP